MCVCERVRERERERQRQRQRQRDRVLTSVVGRVGSAWPGKREGGRGGGGSGHC